MLKLLILIFCIAVSSLVPLQGSAADGTEFQEREEWVKEPSSPEVAVIDKRLPPVIPGQTVSDGTRKIKVWSTSGPVPVSPPAAPGAPGTPGVVEPQPPVTGESLEVIVDARDNDKRGPRR